MARLFALAVMLGGGVLAVVFGWWLFSGSTSGEFTCSISFIPCEMAGLLFVAGGVGWCGLVVIVALSTALRGVRRK